MFHQPEFIQKKPLKTEAVKTWSKPLRERKLERSWALLRCLYRVAALKGLPLHSISAVVK
jgi:hypothetical protein